MITYKVQAGLSVEEQGRRISEAAGGQLKLAIECTGVESSINTAVHSVKFGSMVFVIGVGGDNYRNIPFTVRLLKRFRR